MNDGQDEHKNGSQQFGSLRQVLLKIADADKNLAPR